MAAFQHALSWDFLHHLAVGIHIDMVAQRLRLCYILIEDDVPMQVAPAAPDLPAIQGSLVFLALPEAQVTFKAALNFTINA